MATETAGTHLESVARRQGQPEGRGRCGLVNEPRTSVAVFPRPHVSYFCLLVCFHLFIVRLLLFRNTIWPGGVRPHHHGDGEGAELGTEGEEERGRSLRAVLARAKLIGSVPDDLRRLLGTRRTTQGMARLVVHFGSEWFAMGGGWLLFGLSLWFRVVWYGGWVMGHC